MIKDLFLYLLSAACFYYAIKFYIVKSELLKEREYFVKTLSHDIRVAVIAQIRGLEFLKKYLNTDSEIYSEILNSCQYTLEMISMLINSYTYKSGENVLLYEETNISEIFDCSLDDLKKLADEKGVELLYSVENSDITADKSKLTKAILILISAAIYYSTKSGVIRCKTNLEGNNITISISYLGLSLSEEDKNRMFNKNSRFSVVGCGIKMHFCKEIISFHHGTLELNSHKNFNEFIVKIPIKPVNNALSQPCYFKQKILKNV